MTKLVIVESPTKARTIRGFLPSGYQVEASMGHIRDLPASASEVPDEFKSEAWSRLGVNAEERHATTTRRICRYHIQEMGRLRTTPGTAR